MLARHPEHCEKFWDHAKNELSPAQAPAGSKKLYHFTCPRGHSFQSTLARMDRVPPERYCLECHSFAHHFPHLLEAYSERNPKPAREASAKGGRGGVLLVCPQGHEFAWRPKASSKKPAGQLCPECSSAPEAPPKKRKLSLGEAVPWVEGYWDFERNERTPQELLPTTSGRFFFKCPRGHEFERGLGSLKRQGREFCPQCRLEAYSFAALHPEAAKQWSGKNGKRPQEVMAGAAGLFKFECGEGHEWETSLRTASSGRCPRCFSQESELERSVRTFLFEEGLSPSHLNSRRVAPPFEVDLSWASRRKALEVNGDFYHCDEGVASKTRFPTAEAYHRAKLQAAAEAGVELAFLWGHQWTSHRGECERALREWLAGRPLGELPLLERLSSVLEEPCELCGS